jgi:cytochrome c oxidase assembly protein subunit 15
MLSTTTLRRLIILAAALTLFIVSASAYLRLAGNGLGCVDWPSCYTSVTLADQPAIAAADIVRGAHRVAASVLGLVLIALVLFGWEALSDRRAAAVTLLLLTLFLAWLGRHTPSALPAVTVGNLAGGITLFGLLAWMLVRGDAAEAPRTTSRTTIGLAGATVLLATLGQAVTGALMSVRHAAAACPSLPLCAPAMDGVLQWQVFNPFVDAEHHFSETSLQALHAAHRLCALAVVIAAVLAFRASRDGNRPLRRATTALLIVVAAQLALGMAILFSDWHLQAAVAHNIGAVLTAAGGAWVMQRQSEPP